MPSEPAAPDWYSHGLNRVAYYRLAPAAAAALPRPARGLDAWSPPDGRA